MALTREDCFEIVCMCHAAMAQDSPYPSDHYINQILNYAFAHLTSFQKKELEEYLADKKYLPPLPELQIVK